jgi:hypothetical protein
MAGKARLNAALTQCEHEALDFAGDVAEWLTERIANGDTVLQIADEMTRETGIEISRNVLMKALRQLVPHLDAVLSTARNDAAHAIIERRREKVEDLDGGSSKEEIAAERLKLSSDQWLSERLNKTDFGSQKGQVNLTVNLGELHRNVIEAKSAEDAKRLRSGEEDVVDAEIISDPEDLV